MIYLVKGRIRAVRHDRFEGTTTEEELDDLRLVEAEDQDRAHTLYERYWRIKSFLDHYTVLDANITKMITEND